MAILLNWLEGVARVIAAGGELSATHHRVIYPGGAPLHGSGLVRHQALEAVQRPGSAPERLALMSFFVPAGTESTLAQPDLARALGASITFILNRRVEVTAELPMAMQDEPGQLTFMSLSGLPDRSLIGPLGHDQRQLDSALREHLALLAGLEPADVDVICAALDMHYGACLLMERDVASAYTLLIAGIETLSRRFGGPPTDWQDWDQAAHWDMFAQQHNLSEEQAAALRQELIRDKQLRLNETFATYASTALPEEFFNEIWQDWLFNYTMPAGTFDGGTWQDLQPVEAFVPRDRAELKRALKRSYVARSGFVHAAERSVNLSSEAVARIAGDPKGRLSLVALRLVLRALVDHELRIRSGGNAQIPDLTFTLEESAPEPERPLWSTPKPGARPARSPR